MLKAVLFDMDGVIFDSEPIHFEVEKSLFGQLNLPVTDEEHFKFTGVSCRDMWTSLKIKYSFDTSVEEMVALNWKAYYENLSINKNVKPGNGLVSLLKELKRNKVKLAVASSGSLENIRFVLSMFEIDMFFDSITSGDEVEKSKPDPAIFLLAARRLNVIPTCCVVIEDSENGVKAAKHAGMRCVGLQNPSSGNQDLSKADVTIRSLKDAGYWFLQKLIE